MQETQQIALGQRPVDLDVGEHEQLREPSGARVERQVQLLADGAVRAVGSHQILRAHRRLTVGGRQPGGHTGGVLGEAAQLDAPLDRPAEGGETVGEDAFRLVLRQPEVGVRQLRQVPLDAVGLVPVDDDDLAVEPDAGVHRLLDDALVLPDLHRPAVHADGLVRLARRLGAPVHQPAGDPAAGEFDGEGQAGRSRADDQHVGCRVRLRPPGTGNLRPDDRGRGRAQGRCRALLRGRPRPGAGVHAGGVRADGRLGARAGVHLVLRRAGDDREDAAGETTVEEGDELPGAVAVVRIPHPGQKGLLGGPFRQQVERAGTGFVQQFLPDPAGHPAHGLGDLEERLLERVLLAGGHGGGDQHPHRRPPPVQGVQHVIGVAFGVVAQVAQGGGELVPVRAAPEGVQRRAVLPVGHDHVLAGPVRVAHQVLADVPRHRADDLRRLQPGAFELLLTAGTGAHAQQRAHRVGGGAERRAHHRPHPGAAGRVHVGHLFLLLLIAM